MSLNQLFADSDRLAVGLHGTGHFTSLAQQICDAAVTLGQFVLQRGIFRVGSPNFSYQSRALSKASSASPFEPIKSVILPPGAGGDDGLGHRHAHRLVLMPSLMSLSATRLRTGSF
jgi:hypothetical protein